MRKLLPLLALSALLFTAGCESDRTLSDGKTYSCIGVVETPDPHLTYNLSGRNIVVGVVFSELMFIPPAVVLVKETKCPTGFTQPTVQPR